MAPEHRQKIPKGSRIVFQLPSWLSVVFAVKFRGCIYPKNHPRWEQNSSKLQRLKTQWWVGTYILLPQWSFYKGLSKRGKTQKQIREVCTWTPQETMFLFWKLSVFVKQNPSVFWSWWGYSRCSFALGVSQNHDPGKKIHLSNLSFSPNFKKLQIRWTPPVVFWKLPST